MDRLISLLLATAAVAAIYLGYTLLCELPATRGAGRIKVILLNLIPGALLTIAGAGILTTQAQTLIARHRALHHPATGRTTEPIKLSEQASAEAQHRFVHGSYAD